MDIEVFPYRVLGSDTTEALLNDLESLEDVKRTVIQGPRFPKGEATLPPQYQERRVININGEDVAKVMRLEYSDDNFEDLTSQMIWIRDKLFK